MNLSDKITTLEQFLETEEGSHYAKWEMATVEGHRTRVVKGFVVPINTISGSVASNDAPLLQWRNEVPAQFWWFCRDALRYYKSRDTYGAALMQLWEQPVTHWYSPRPHKDDPVKIEFYPDARAAMAERPVVTTIGRFLARVNPAFSDAYIKAIDELHRSEMSLELEILTGVEGIRAAYLEGPSSCMSKPWHDAEKARGTEYAASAPWFNGVHPVDAYDMPGMGVAVTRDPKGKINGRCLVYTNGEDKRAIRVYGDASLKRRLLRNGYVFRGLSKMPLKLIPVKTPELLTMPASQG